MLEGLADEVAAAPTAKGWKPVTGTLAAPSGALVMFDANARHARTRAKQTLALAAGDYAIEVLRKPKTSLWVVRLRPTAAVSAPRAAARARPTTSGRGSSR